MAFPHQGYTLGETPADAERARAAWAAVAAACAEFEPVTMVVDPADVGHAERHLAGHARDGARIDIVTTALDDAWMRDMGPTFVLDARGRLGAVDWVFNGWGAQDWATWKHDEDVGAFVAQRAGAQLVSSPLVNEGGGFHVDGEGTALATRSVQLDPHRNPGLVERDVEDEFRRVLGVEKVIWLDRGLTRDAQEFGTRGHVDIVATFSEPGVVLVHDQQDARHPDHAISAEVVETLSQAVDACGRRLRVECVPAPTQLRDDEGWVDFSYINHLVVDGGVIACRFADADDEESPAARADAAAVAVLERAYPGRRVVTVDAREIFVRGGGIHCITQQQPSTPTDEDDR
ncbi:Putative agmatine deiminase [Dermacoccus nishinomiyaensis]|nr:Putative agmatine deiminase [Dermacoccus nishinomiyaensis]